MCDSRSAHNHYSNQGYQHQQEENDIDEPESSAKPQPAPVGRYSPEGAVPKPLRQIQERGYAQANPDPQK